MSIAPSPDTNALEVKGTDLVSQLDAFRIENVREVAPAVLVASLEGSSTIARLADDYLREVESSFGPLAKAAHEAHRKIVAERDRLKGPAETLKRDAGLLGHACNAELKRREEEQRQAQERERQRLQKIADDEAEAERTRLQKIADDERLAQAEQAELVGDHDTAAKLIEAPVVVPEVRAAPVFVPPPLRLAPEIKGQTFTEDWVFEVTNAALVPREYLMLDEVKIGKVVRAMKGTTNIPGIRAITRPRTTVRSSSR
jgi:hypothetical protein